ncbi:hypothetical protein NLJ89_g634 [Agrocybe chaxingu]|uniref:F-box domain-containing protein n=1 Tax=Agrocybe chaxingu TaxID=84603 RepID=A0A9W8N1K9_9AGAR|nr:hypothetical protein NLJ89_g634 [Agrocybe chaxingu]
MRRCISSIPPKHITTKAVTRSAKHTWPQLPPELTDNIIDFLANDAASLKACGLTCRIFLPSSRKHLFRRVVLRPSASKATPSGKLVAFLLSTPHLLPYVASLRLVEGDFQLDGRGRYLGWMARDYQLATLLARLPNITEFSLESTYRPLEWNNLPKGLKVSIRGILKSAQLTDLALGYFLDITTSCAFMLFFMRARTATFPDVRPNEDVVHHPLVLEAMPNLKSLKLGVEISDFDTASANPSLLWVSTVLNSVPPSNALEEITLKCEIIFGNPLRQIDRAIWKTLDWSLTCEALGNLRKVKFLIHTVHCSEALPHKFGTFSSFLDNQLVILRRRGILCIEEVYG